mmetsp:Transcript_43324/g.110259  ORF Transcript_43324/g.110259 Transcript_43324/m.110259 type:complete len:370 (+) Transcript_43324:94-1203(+)
MPIALMERSGSKFGISTTPSSSSSRDATTREGPPAEHSRQARLLHRASFTLSLPTRRRDMLFAGFRSHTRNELDGADKETLLAAVRHETRPVAVCLPSGGTIERLSELELGFAGMLYQPTCHIHQKKAVWVPLQMVVPRPAPGLVALPDELDEDDACCGISRYGRLLEEDEVKELADGNDAFESTCPICLSEVTGEDAGPVFQLRCQHIYHKDCIEHWFNNKQRCPQCQQDFGKVTGSQPRIGSMDWQFTDESLPGHEDAKETIVVHFTFPKGLDEQGRAYQGRCTKCFLPANNEGFILLELFKVAFRRRVMYGLGQSMTRDVYRPTFNIHLKTSRKRGIEGHGYPDASYFSRALEELRANGVTIADLA